MGFYLIENLLRTKVRTHRNQIGICPVFFINGDQKGATLSNGNLFTNLYNLLLSVCVLTLHVEDLNRIFRFFLTSNDLQSFPFSFKYVMSHKRLPCGNCLHFDKLLSKQHKYSSKLKENERKVKKGKQILKMKH